MRAHMPTHRRAHLVLGIDEPEAQPVQADVLQALEMLQQLQPRAAAGGHGLRWAGGLQHPKDGARQYQAGNPLLFLLLSSKLAQLSQNLHSNKLSALVMYTVGIQ